ncbi:hypothetical protein FA95DRAFT_1487924 [Auriscalpium vulgare]|uniref:Uncharacterized protein n=1 Tax=Auriscalpium vulgare TaxID=40419 RepID=A0ACB8S294_9AGAM|nr:hypothetical protein FA95DRAFT_1487924 [Auriscalpium vulgare]
MGAPLDEPFVVGGRYAHLSWSSDEVLTDRRRTLSDIKAAIPPELFARSTLKSCLYLLRDLVLAISLGLGAYYSDSWLEVAGLGEAPTTAARVVLWGLYWWFQGLVFAGLWVMGHECGHSAFSSSKKVSDAVGFVVHTALGMPYLSWGHAHALHHMNHAHALGRKTEHVGHDVKMSESFPLLTEHSKEDDTAWESIKDTPLYLVPALVLQRLHSLWRAVTFQSRTFAHQDFIAPLTLTVLSLSYSATIVSDAGLLGVAGLLYYACSRIGVVTMCKVYFVPWLLFSFWISMAVLLQHTVSDDGGAPTEHREGQLSSMDRSFLGWQGKFFLHNMGHCHIIHHLFPELPFYNAPAATEKLKSLLGAEYRHCDASIFVVLWKITRSKA